MNEHTKRTRLPEFSSGSILYFSGSKFVFFKGQETPAPERADAGSRGIQTNPLAQILSAFNLRSAIG